jgi:transcription factor TFIIIB component B''
MAVVQMIDNEVDFGNILDAPEEVQPAVTLNIKPHAKPWKATLKSKSSVPNPAAATKDGKAGVVTQENSSEGLSNSQGRESLTCTGSETIDDIACSKGVLETPSEDVLTIPLVSLKFVSDSVAGGASAVGSVSQDGEHVDDASKLGTHHESLVVSDGHAMPASSCGKTIDDIVDFGETFDAQAKEETFSKLLPKVQAKLPKLAAKSRKTNQKVSASTIGVVIQNERSDTDQIGLKDDHVQAPRCHDSGGHTSDSEALMGGKNITIAYL